MDLYPAIDLLHGRVVRLSQGEATRQTVYGDDPAAIAERFAADGASWIHVVDLDRAFGSGENRDAVGRIVRRLAGKSLVQLGGGMRTLPLVREGLDLGASRVVIGTAPAIDPDLVPEAVAIAGDRVAVGIDTRDGMVAVRGWTQTSTLSGTDLARRVTAHGVETLVYTDVARDGMLGGPDVAGAAALRRLGARVIASGGIGSLDDLRALREAGLEGAIVGRALYEGRFTLSEALEAV